MKRTALVTVVVAAIVVGSFLPWRTKMLLGTMQRNVIVTLPGVAIHLDAHRILHMFAFGLAAWLLTRAVHSWRERWYRALLVCLLALAVEVGESRVFLNRMEWGDVLDDVLGVAAAMLIGLLERDSPKGTAPPP